LSAILRALKKLEKDASVDADMPSLPGKSRIGRMPDRSVRLSYGLVFTAFILAAGFAVFIKMHPSVFVSGSTERTSLPANERIAAVNGAEQPSPEANTPKTDFGKASNGSAPSASAEAHDDSAAPGVEKPETDGARDPGKTEPLMAAPGPNEKKEAPEENVKADISGAKQASSGASVPLFSEDIGLKIQAISWNESPSQRIVIINSRLCHEGDRISGYRVLEINPDDIVVSNGVKTGKLLFKIH